MSFQPGANVYTQGFGSRPENVEVPHLDVRAPTASDTIYPVGKIWVDTVANQTYTLTSQSSIGGVLSSNWSSGGNAEATTTTPGIVQLATLTELENGTAPAGAIVPLSNDVFTFVNATAISGGTPATVAAQGFVFLATNAMAQNPGLVINPNTVLIPSNLATVFASPPAIGGTAPAAGAFTTLAASGATTLGSTLAVTGVSTLAAMTATTGSFSSTLGVTGLTTLAALTAVGTANINASGAAVTNIATGGTGALNIGNATGNTSLTGDLSVSGDLTLSGNLIIADLTAVNGTFSGTLGVTGASSFSSGTFSTTLGVTGLTTLAAHTAVGTALINASGSAVTTIGTGGTGAVQIGNATGNTAITGAVTISTTLGVTGLTTLAALTQAGVTLINTTGSAATSIATGGTGALNLGNAASGTTVTGSLTSSGNIIINGAATQLRVHGGAVTDFIGTATLVLGTVTVANTNIAAGDRIYLSRVSINGSTALGMYTYTISAGASFTVTSVDPATPANTLVADISIFTYFIVRQV